MSAAFLWSIVIVGIILFIFMISQTSFKPVRWVFYGLFKLALGGILLFVFNSIAGYYDFTIPINPVTAALSGFLGLPGLVSLVVIKAFILV